MNIESILRNVDIIGGRGKVISTEDKVKLYNSLIILQNENHFRDVYFWGCIYGEQKDYYIAYGYVNDILFGQIFYYSNDCMNWGRLPPPVELPKLLTPICSNSFLGDPLYRTDVYCDKHDPRINGKFGDHSVVCTLKEEDRLSATVHYINEEGRAVPRGGIFKRPDNVVVQNWTFTGLNEVEACDQMSYLHFRKPRFTTNQNLLSRKDYNYGIDFLDPIGWDIPPNCWAFNIYNGYMAYVESLYWPGMVCYHEINTPKYGYVYFGNGRKNYDIPFMQCPIPEPSCFYRPE